MKKYLALVFFALVTSVAFAQSDYQDVVYLKNGSIIRGIIIEQVPDKSIKIETEDRNIFVYQMDEIEKLSKEPFKNSTGLESGYKGIIELGYQLGTGLISGSDAFKLNFINGYQINPYFALGIGTGLRYYIDGESVLIPIFADFRANLMENKISPYFSLDVGYTFNASDGFKGLGLLFNPTVGASFKVSDKSAMNVGLGYEMQKETIHYTYYGDDYTEKFNYGFININVGISF